VSVAPWQIASFAIGALWLAWLVRAIARDVSLHRAYVDGDVERVEGLIGTTPDKNLAIALNCAIGRYGEAMRAAETPSRVLDVTKELAAENWLHRINACEALVELGRAEEAIALLTPAPLREPLIHAGRAVGLAWTLTCVGRHEEALELLESANPAHLGKDYRAEASLTRVLVLLNLGRLGDARVAIDECRGLVVRASTERNLLLHEARWQLLSGKLEDAEKTFIAARDHRWKRQGGSGFLALGDAFRDAGRPELARECWTLSAQQDPESASAQTARDRLARNAEVPS